MVEQSRQQPLLRDHGALESAVAQPPQTFGGEDLYPSLVAKAAALGFSLIQNHPFIDGNKRVGHAAMVALLRVNGRRLEATVAARGEGVERDIEAVVDRDAEFNPTQRRRPSRPWAADEGRPRTSPQPPRRLS